MAPLSPLHRPDCARLGVMRLNAARLNVYEAWTAGLIDGVNPGTGSGLGLRIERATIDQILNDQVDTASFRVSGLTPVAGQAIEVYSGDTDLTHALFGGRILETTALYEGVKRNVAYDLRCIDPTWLLSRQLVLATYANQSATAIVLDLVARFTRNVTTRGVVAGLAIIPEITFTNEPLPQCLTTICERIGASWYLDYQGDLHVFLNEAETATPITETSVGSRDHQLREDLSQVATRVIGRGGGVGTAIDLPAGQPELPVDEGNEQTWYSPSGGTVEVAAQRVTYTGVKGRGGTGAIIGTGNVPTTPLTISGISGAGLGAGTYQYAETFTNVTGETLPGPLKSIQLGFSMPPLKTIPARSRFSQGLSPQSGMIPGGRYSWKVALLYGGGGYALGPPTPTYTVDQYPWEIGVGVRAIDPTTGFYYLPGLQDNGKAQILQVQIYRTTNGGSTWYVERSYADVPYTTSGYLETANGWDDPSIVNQPQYPTGPIATLGQAVIRAPMSSPPSGFTGLNLYRTAVNASQLQRLVTGANPSADYVDSTPDGSLGVTAPTSDTSGVVASSGSTVQPGATEFDVTSTAPFAADGGAGWVRVGDLVIRYTGIAGTKLTGIPATGTGAITAAIRHGAQVLVQPRLVGLPPSGAGALVRAIKKGDTVTIVLIVQDDAAIAAMADRLKLPGQAAVTADGVIEDVLSDSRFTLTELDSNVRARLAERKDPIRTLTFQSRDPSLQVGRLITVTLTQPPISGTFRIQRIGLSEIAITGARGTLYPLRTVEATNKLFTFADLLRQLRGREGGVPV